MVKDFALCTSPQRWEAIWHNLSTLKCSSEVPQLEGDQYDESCRKVAIAVAVDCATSKGSIPLDLKDPMLDRWHTRMRQNLQTTFPDRIPPARENVEEKLLDLAEGLIPTVKHCGTNSFARSEEQSRLVGAWTKQIAPGLTPAEG